MMIFMVMVFSIVKLISPLTIMVRIIISLNALAAIMIISRLEHLISFSLIFSLDSILMS